MRDNYTDIRTLYYNLLQDNITLNGNTVNVYDVVKANETNPYIYFAEFEAIEDSCKDNFTTRVTIGLVVVSKFTNAVGGSADVDNVANQILKLLHNDTYLNNSNFRVVLNKMIANFVTKQPTQTGMQINKTIRLEHVVEQIGGDLTRITDLTATRVSNTQIDLAWSNVTGNTGYRIERSTDGYTWALVTSVAQDVVTYSNTGLTNDVTYSYRVRAFDATGGSAWSNIASATAYSDSGVTPSGIAYQRPLPTLQTTSYAVYDDAWQLANGGYSWTTPANPLYIQELDLDTDATGSTLLYNNAFGNKIRFTDINGDASADVQNIYVIDNLTGLGYYVTGASGNVRTYNNAFGVGGLLESYNLSNYQGYNDWFFANLQIAYTLTTSEGSGSNVWILPYRRVASDNYNLSTSYDNTYCYYMNKQFQSYYNSNKSVTARHWLATRIHF